MALNEASCDYLSPAPVAGLFVLWGLTMSQKFEMRISARDMVGTPDPPSVWTGSPRSGTREAPSAPVSGLLFYALAWVLLFQVHDIPQQSDRHASAWPAKELRAQIKPTLLVPKRN